MIFSSSFFFSFCGRPLIQSSRTRIFSERKRKFFCYS